MPAFTGCLDKMVISPGSPAEYQLPLNEQRVPLNSAVGQPLRLRFTGIIRCTHCQRKTNKSFNQGYCFPCFKKLAQCDTCIVSPEKCHLHLGTCREPEWANQHCQTDQIVYLANASGIKIGITRASQMPTRWLDQGAIQALPIARVATRYQSGLFEVMCKAFVADKTDWRALLRGDAATLDLAQQRDQLFSQTTDGVAQLQARFGINLISLLPCEQPRTFSYPVQAYPEKVTTLNLDKDSMIEGVLTGIKGQYLLFAHGAINIRKFTGYEVELSL